MKGYCSNSPLRCSEASTGKIIESTDHCCPKCLKAMIIIDNEKEHIVSVKRILMNIMLVVWLGMLVLYIILFLVGSLPSPK